MNVPVQEIKEHKKLCEQFLEVADKSSKYNKLSAKWGCPLEIIDRLIDQNRVVVKFHNELQVYNSIKIDLRNKKIWYCRQTGGHYACCLPLSQYKIHFWLKEDLSE